MGKEEIILNKMKYVIGKYGFSSKKGIENKAREILNSNADNSILSEEDLLFMIKYFARFHIQWEEKKGCGIKNIRRVRDSTFRKNRYFSIERKDDSSTDISFIINNIQKKDYNREFRQAMREVVHDQIQAFKMQAFNDSKILICPLLNIPIAKETCHIDHYEPTFKELIKNFIKENQLVLTEDLFPKSSDNQKIYTITDKELSMKFYDFHKDKAILRAVSNKGNLRRERK